MNTPHETSTFLGFPATSPAGRSILEGRELAPDFPRQWLEFHNPEDPNHLFKVDITWLTAQWRCHFGQPECLGIDENNRVVGCCNHGAFLTDESDQDLLYNSVAEMPAKFWQLRPAEVDEYIAAADATEIEPWLEWDELENEDGEMEPALKTKLVDGACIFANRTGHGTGPGCALHQYAMASGQDITEIKPEVCWLVPLRREEEWVVRADGADILTTTISEYERRAWGNGGEDFDWWCTSAPSCHTSEEPMWRSYETELRRVMGDASYDRLVELITQTKGSALAHPATVAARERR
ncbi:hypothetical protein CCICO_10380 [Corynebacterium ciconiae DSM 44920]|uniref:hypothetical protein n=1 Tax=Corynebacterium ciconiae TaxID=227319 RepID=UPI00037D8296|nr:hypothetical protein [Corynebacterium ciconiae]WKD62075.1 hypothetical protein CCICO_10380 [Corynebacterium ciconiae DSM 44920]